MLHSFLEQLAQEQKKNNLKKSGYTKQPNELMRKSPETEFPTPYRWQSVTISILFWSVWWPVLKIGSLKTRSNENIHDRRTMSRHKWSLRPNCLSEGIVLYMVGLARNNLLWAVSYGHKFNTKPYCPPLDRLKDERSQLRTRGRSSFSSGQCQTTHINAGSSDALRVWLRGSYVSAV